MDYEERLDQFRARLLVAPGCVSKDEAFALLTQTLIDVEDEFSGIAFDSSYPRDSGRMYPPREDAHRAVLGRADLHRYRSKRHHTYVSESGAILIVDLDKAVVLDKPDADERSIMI